MMCIMRCKSSFSNEELIEAVEDFSSFIYQLDLIVIPDEGCQEYRVSSKYAEMVLKIVRKDYLSKCSKCGLYFYNFESGEFKRDTVYKKNLNSAVWKVVRKSIYKHGKVLGRFKRKNMVYEIEADINVL